MLPSNPLRRRLLGGLLGGLLPIPWAVHAAAPGRAAAPLLLAQDAAADIDPAGHLVSEKFDGVRAWWDGAALRFRSGRVIRAPAWFTALLPALALDGELWLGRGRFEALSAAVRRHVPRDDEWHAIRYMVFELPDAPGPFTQRVQRLQQIAQAAGHPSLQVAEQTAVADRLALRQRLDAVVAAGGEGLMLHRADAAYVSGRSAVLLKLKPLADAEAVVLAHLPGRGKHSGRLGALQVRTAQGVAFAIGTGFSDADREQPPPAGSSISFTHRGFTETGVPRFASYLRRREAE